MGPEIPISLPQPDAPSVMTVEPMTVEPMTRLDALREQEFRRLAVTFVNHMGLPLAKAIPLERVAIAATQGLGFSPVSDAFGASGAIDPLQSLARPDGDLRLIPDLNSLAVLDQGAGWAWDQLHPEYGPGQLELSLAPSAPCWPPMPWCWRAW
jgi:glutamine synthetase